MRVQVYTKDELSANQKLRLGAFRGLRVSLLAWLLLLLSDPVAADAADAASASSAEVATEEKVAYVVLACALDLEHTTDVRPVCDASLDGFLPQDAISVSTRIYRGKVALWFAPLSCNVLSGPSELVKHPHCSPERGAAMTSEAGLLRLKKLEVDGKSYNWLAWQHRHSRFVILDITRVAKASGWTRGKLVSIRWYAEGDAAGAFSFLYGWWYAPHSDDLAFFADTVSLFFPTGLFAIGGDAGGLRAAALPLGIGIGTKFLPWKDSYYLGLSVFASYTIQGPNLRSDKGDSQATDDINPFALAFGGLADFSGKLYLGYATILDLDHGDGDSGSKLGHYLVVGSPLGKLF